MKSNPATYIRALLADHSVKTLADRDYLLFSKDDRSLRVSLTGEGAAEGEAGEPVIHLDQLITAPEKIAAIVLSKLKLNTTVFARSCSVKKTDKTTAKMFLETYHMMNATQSAYNLGLFYKEELIALASFSKGRKMDRLPEDQRSFELIRFCCKSGITVTGGLTRLVKNFCEERGAGDIMTYVDRQLSDGKAFLNAGFKKHGETPPNYFLVNRKTFERIPAAQNLNPDPETFYLSHNAGNYKFVYTPGEHI